MNLLKLVSALIMITTVSTAMAAQTRVEKKVARLQATNGTEITITYDRNETLIEGQSRTAVARNIFITAAKPHNLGSPGHSIRAVLVNTCRQRYSDRDIRAIYTCDLRMGASGQAVPGAMVSSDCQIDGDSYDVNYLNRYSGLLVSIDTSNNRPTRCTQSVALVVDGVWLKDPMNGSSDFRLQF